MRRAVVSLVVAIGTAILVLYAGNAVGHQTGHVPVARQRMQGVVELPGKRTATSDTYVLPNGEREVKVYEAPINFRDAQGNWQPIEEGFKRNGLAIEDRSHPFAIRLPSQMGGGGPVMFGGSKHWISFELAGGETGQAEFDRAGLISYELPASGTSFEYTTLPNGLKETIDLAEPGSPATVHYRLSTAPGITPEISGDGSIDFREKAGKLVAVMPAPTVSDATSNFPESGQAHYTLSRKGEANWSLGVEVSRSWIEAPDRVWPVRIDPTLHTVEAGASAACDLTPVESVYTNGQLSFCQAGSGFARWLDALEEHATKGLYLSRAIMNFDLSGIPADAEIREASVNLYSPENTTASGVELRRILTPWNGSTANWWCAYRDSSGCHSWTTAGGDFNGEGSEILTSERGVQPGWWRFTKGLAAVFQGWQLGNARAGLLLKLKNEGQTCSVEAVGCQKSFHAEWPTAAEPSKRPYVRVVYLPKAPTSNQVTLPTEGTTTARRLKLKAKWGEEGSVGGVTFEYRTNPKEKGAFKPIPPELVYRANGEPIKEWPIHSSFFEAGKFQTQTLYFDAAHVESKLQEGGGPIYIRAVFDGTAGVEGFTDPVEAVINRVIGSPHDATASVGPGSLDLETGNLSISHTDVSIPGFKSSLQFERTYNSRAPHPVSESEKAEPPSVLGPGWKTGIPVEEAGESEYRSVRMVVFSGELEDEVGENCEVFEVEGKEVKGPCTPEFVKLPYRVAYADVTSNDGRESWFEEASGGSFVTPPELTGWKLAKNSEGSFVLSDTQGDITTFKTVGGGEEYLPFSISQPGGAGNTTRLEWIYKSGEKQLRELIAPSAPGIECSKVTVSEPIGCHALEFGYAPVGSSGERLISISYLAPGNLATASEVAHYEYDSAGRLVAEWDPRISPPLKEQYAYEANGQLKAVTPPGQKPWTFEYAAIDKEAGVGRLTKVKRASLLASPAEAQTTIAYNVPISGVGAPYQMGGSEVGQWGQTDLPVEATAIFPPSEVPTANPPTSWTQATIYYLDSEGYAVNTATPKGGGTGNPSISTAEPNEYGDIVRELSPDNRLAVLAEPEAGRRAKWEELETSRRYTEEGTQMVEELGPMHQIRIVESGKTEPGRLKRVVEYDKGWPGTGVKPHLPTLETTYAKNSAGGVSDKKETETQYNWNLRKPTKTIVDPGTGHLNITGVTVYDEATGLPLETRRPKSAGEATGAGVTKFRYYRLRIPGANCEIERVPDAYYAGLPCEVRPGAQTSGTGRPELLVKKFAAYDALGEPTEVLESPGGTEVKSERRITTTAYDAAGRLLTTKIEGGGTAIPKTETIYNTSTGFAEKQQFTCAAGECGLGSGYQNFAYQSSFGSSGTGNGQFAHPAGIALDSSGNLWVVDESNNRLEKFNSNGEFLKAVGSIGSGNGQFSRPTDVAIDAAGNLLVTDAGNNRIEKLNSNGEFVSSFGSHGSGNGQFNAPESIAIANGHIWVADTYNHRLQEFTEAGVFIRTVGCNGSGEGQMVEPTGIALGPEESVWVADWGDQRVEEFNESGSFVRQFGTEGTENGQFKRPDVIEVDPSGDVFVGDQNNERVQEFGPKGEFIGKFGTTGTGAGQFSFGWPMGLASDAKGDLWVADTGNNRVQKWTGTAAANQEASTTAYNALGQATEYRDADGNQTKLTYDIDGRTITESDNKGTQTYHYDETSGLLTSLEDSGAGTFTATYDADGNLIERGLPNGLTAKTSYNAVDEPIGIAYTKSACEKECSWYEETLERSVYGQILTDGNSLAADRYRYDNAGRLTETQETPAASGQCTSREYGYDPDSNRTSQTVRVGVGGICPTSGGTTQKYEYDAADRLMGAGLTYDNMGRITNLPAEYAGNKVLETKYFADDTVASQTQGGVTNTYELDASLRQRQRIQAGGVGGTEIFHYDTPGDSPSWTALGSTWCRNIVGIGGELAATQESNGTLTFSLTDLHGDVVAIASSSPAATAPVSTARFDEFGERESGSSGRFGWLGGKLRRTELASGVIQMGARSYIPQLGRFLTPDPMESGSANAYGYAEADPVNNFDLGGNCSKNLCLARQYPPKPKKSNPSGGGASPNPRAEASTTNEPSPLNPSHSVHIAKEGCQLFETGKAISDPVGTKVVVTVLYICNGAVSVAGYIKGPGIVGLIAGSQSNTGKGTLIVPVEYPGPPGIPLTLCLAIAYTNREDSKYFCQSAVWIFT